MLWKSNDTNLIIYIYTHENKDRMIRNQVKDSKFGIKNK